jgi:ABC-type polysaccharide/polyol phosphate transport system ATPase subunit
MGDAGPVIEVENVSKRFRLRHERSTSLKTLVLRRSGVRTETLWALRDVSFEVPAGQTLAIVGHNGSGKSTLLGLLAHVYRPTEGAVRIHGRIAPLLELGAGFHDDLTGLENIALHGSILGLTGRRVRELTPSIIDFAELDRFIDTPLRSYSAGMVMRLGFSIAVHSDPDVLLIDEVLAVGDESFQKKCYRRIHGFQQAGKTIVFVSHDLDAVRRVAGRALWIHGGGVRMDGPASQVVDAYEHEAAPEEPESP